MALFAEGFVKYPEELPCPQVDTDLKPRERRYISDIGEVKRLRRFQSTFQAERQKISFIFTREQAEEFQKWYKEDIIEGGVWFYADWPILHKEKRIAYRFVTRPVWEFLARGVYHVTASVETYERKVGRAANVYTSKIYPLYSSDGVTLDIAKFNGRLSPYYNLYNDSATLNVPKFSATGKEWIYSDYAFNGDRIILSVPTFTATGKEWIYSEYHLEDDGVIVGIPTFSVYFGNNVRFITYSYLKDDITLSIPSFSGAMT